MKRHGTAIGPRIPPGATAERLPRELARHAHQVAHDRKRAENRKANKRARDARRRNR